MTEKTNRTRQKKFQVKTDGNILLLVMITCGILLSFGVGLLSFFQSTTTEASKNFASEKAYFGAESAMEILLSELKKNNELEGELIELATDNTKISAKISAFTTNVNIELAPFEVFLFPQKKCTRKSPESTINCENLSPLDIQIKSKKEFLWKIRCDNKKSIEARSKNFSSGSLGKTESFVTNSIHGFWSQNKNQGCYFSFSALNEKIPVEISSTRSLVPKTLRVLTSQGTNTFATKKIQFQKGQRKILQTTEFGILHQEKNE